MNYRIIAGIDNIKAQKWKIICPIGCLVIMLFAAVFVKQKIVDVYITMMPNWIYCICVGSLTVIVLLAILSWLGTPIQSKRIEKALSGIHIGTKSYETPHHVSVTSHNGNVTYTFYSKQHTLAEYRDKQDKIETALNIQIISIEQGKDKRHVLIEWVPPKNKLPDVIKWDNKYLNDKDFVLALGVSQTGTVSIDLNAIPHLLCGSGTNGGKTTLLKTLLWQCIMKQATVIIADFKGGVDFPMIWREKCELITTPEELSGKLEKVLEIMEERRKKLEKSACRNIYEYNEKNEEQLNRIIIAIDEIAEVLDKTGMDKDEKTLVAQIEKQLSTVARQGRAFGEHLFVCTQRPDAEVLKGQIKNNIGYRICGRADKVLSGIVLDNQDAAEKIPKDGKGIFLTNSGVLFKAYYLDETT